MANNNDPPSRSPCPVLNSLANSNLLPASGRFITAPMLDSALAHLGLSYPLRYLLVNATFLPRPAPAFSTFGQKLLHPFGYQFRDFGVWPPGQKNEAGEPVIDLEQVGVHGVVEHDVSLSRRDAAQGDSTTPQPDLIAQLLNITSPSASSPSSASSTSDPHASSSSPIVITLPQLAHLRRLRLSQQIRGNPALHFASKENKFACSEIALLVAVFGDAARREIEREVVRSIFQEERLAEKGKDGGGQEWVKKGQGSWWGKGEQVTILQVKTLTRKLEELVDFTG